jgi:predicted secreted protein
MSIVSAIVLYAVIWFLVLFIVLPIRLVTQGDQGEIVPGTQAGAPANLQMRRKAFVTTIVATIVWAILAAIIVSGMFRLSEMELFRWMVAPSLRDG